MVSKQPHLEKACVEQQASWQAASVQVCTVQEHSASIPVPRESRQQLAEKLQKAGPDSQVVWAGSGVGMIKSLEPATQLVDRLIRETQTVIHRAAKLAARPQTQTES